MNVPQSATTTWVSTLSPSDGASVEEKKDQREANWHPAEKPAKDKRFILGNEGWFFSCETTASRTPYDRQFCTPTSLTQPPPDTQVKPFQ
mmetsp:Transcript_20555/g.33169  ORF Transcript_20555/g.33169 Transcript_20555/m.33169 type:complete len:90 (-) Transcript_20555:452-721(-)